MPRPPRTLDEHLALHERLIIIQTLTANGLSRKRAAEALGLSRKRLWSRMRALGIEARRTTVGRPKKLT
jgi:DNA-binding NtrC family response regulator